MIKNTFLGLGPMSIEVINSIDSFSKKYKKKIMLICSRNQVESEKLGGGYVNNFSTSDFANFVKKKKNNLLIMSRDHCGPFKRDGKSKKNLKNEVENCKISLLDDIKNDFKILHIDTSECGKQKYEIADELITFCNNAAKEYKKKIFFEFGAEDHGVLTNFKKFSKDAKFFSNYSNKQFIVCQTGSLIKSIFQVGQFDMDSVKIMKKIALENGLLLKEHNCDYLNFEQIRLRKEYGINAINIAPELGVIQSNLTYNISKKLKLDNEIKAFKKFVLNKDKWKKWDYNNENKLIKFFSAGHYHFSSNIYKSLIKKINKKINFQKQLDKSIEKNLIRFFN
tara:strand:- start:1444 stop:2454 length:1011 start_codon:yes stop_codon:yes gene_type:complete